MNATLCFLLLLLTPLSFLALGASLSPAQDQRCPANTTISKAEEWANIITVRGDWKNNGYLFKTADLFVHLDPGFKSVRLVATGNEWWCDAWFTLDNTCFPHNAEWRRLLAFVQRPPNTKTNLTFSVSTGVCRHFCTRSGNMPGVPSLEIEAHGPSRWRFTDPKPCTVTPRTQGQYIQKDCNNPPAPKTPTILKTPFTTSTITTTTTTTTLRTVLDQRCPADTVISEAEEWANITTVQDVEMYQHTYWYVHPVPGFMGVSLVAAGDGWRRDTWFTLDTCFPQKAEWWGLSVSVHVYNNRNVDENLQFVVQAGVCRAKCTRTGRFPGDLNLTILAHGPSRWRRMYPHLCTTIKDVAKGDYRETCTEPPLQETKTTSTATKDVVIAVVVVGAVIVVIVVVVKLQRRIRHQRDTPAGDVKRRSQASETVVVENNLYESFENTGGRAVVENSLYEPFENTGGRAVVENSLYEPFENTGGRAVVENSLYQPFESFRDSQPR